MTSGIGFDVDGPLVIVVGVTAEQETNETITSPKLIDWIVLWFGIEIFISFSFYLIKGRLTFATFDQRSLLLYC